MNVSKDIRYIGVNDHQVDLFEGHFDVPLGMAYNSYVILDRKVAVMDTVDQNFGRQWLTNLAAELHGRQPDYLVVQHMEPDHSANIQLFMETYPQATLVSSAKAFPMMKNFFGTEYEERRVVVKEGDVLELGVCLVRTSYGNAVRAYDLERTLCDLVRGQAVVDDQVVSPAMQAYVRRPDRDPVKLVDYARALGVEGKVRTYMKVLL
jgi:hypothetical protein